MQRLIFPVLAIGLLCSLVPAQSLDERLDERRYLQGLSELHTPEVLEHYIAENPTDDPGRQAMFDMARQRLAMRMPDASPSERRERLQAILDIRRALIENYPDDDRRAIWLADQAEDILFELLPQDASVLTVLVGNPPLQQQQHAATQVDQAHQYAEHADDAVRATISELQRRPGFADDASMQWTVRRLAEDHRDRRIVLLRGVGLVLNAELNLTNDERRSAYRDALRMLTPLPPRLTGVLRSRARLYAGIAAARLNDTDRAVPLFRTVIEDAAAHPSDVFIARIFNSYLSSANNTEIATALDDIAASYTKDDEAIYRLLLADQRFRSRGTNTAAAYRAYLDLLDGDLSLSPDAARAVVLDRLSLVVDEHTPFDALPPLVRIAYAQKMSSQSETRAAALDAFEAALADNELTAPDQAAALFGLARTLERANQPLDAAARYVEFARQFPQQQHATAAIQRAASLAAARYQAIPDDAQTREVLINALQVVLERFPDLPDIDRWRFLAAQVALRDGDFDLAVNMFNTVPPGSALYADAQYYKMRSMFDLAAMTENPASQREAYRNAITESDNAINALRRIANDTTDADRRRTLLDHIGGMRVLQAKAHLSLSDATSAVNGLRDIEHDAELDPMILAEALRTRIDALEMRGDQSDAVREVERFADAAPHQIIEVIPPMMDGIERDVRELISRSRDDEAQEKARRELLPLADVIDLRLDDEISSAQRFGLLRRIAVAHQLAGRFEDALPKYDFLLASKPDAADLLIGRAECLYALGGREHHADAFAVYQRLVKSGPSLGVDIYWLSQLRLLQILDAVGRNTEQIGPRIQRLELQDPTLGGPRYRRGFNELRQRHR